MRLLDWLLRRRRDEDLQDEIHAHLAMATEDRIAGGDEAEAARLAALKEFGNVTLTREATRTAWSGPLREWVGDLGQDVRYGVRVLAGSPGYALIVILVLALGIGANVSVFTLFRSLALKPLPGVENSARLGVLVARTSGGRIQPLSYPDFRDLAAEGRSFEHIAGTSMEALSVGLGASGERVWAELVTGNYFQVLDVRARLGRTLLPSDAVTPGKHPVIVISDGFWQRAFGADPAIVGRTVTLSGHPMTVVGVADREFRGSIVSMDVEVFAPLTMQAILQGRDDLSARQVPKVWGLGHLRSGLGVAEAAAEADVLSARLEALHSAREVPQRATVISMWNSPFGAQTYLLPAVMLVSVMGGLLLLIVCANVANLVLVRGVSRRGEIAARLALGASRQRILRLLVIESVVLSIPGAVAGLLASRYLLLLMNGMNAGGAAPGRTYINVEIDALVVAFAMLLACGCAVVFGFFPGLRVSRVDLAGIMKDDLSPRAGSKGRARTVLVVLQVAVSLILLVGASLVVRSLGSARKADLGFDARNVASVALDLQPSGYDEARGHAFYVRLLDALRAEPTLDAVTLAAETPLKLVPGRQRDIEIERYVPRDGEDLRFLINPIASDYFRTLRIRMLAGRDFDRRDTRSSTRVAIVNETLAARFWGTPAQAVGKRLRVGSADWSIVAGVVRDIKYTRPDEDPRPFVYLPFEQYPLAPLLVHARGRDGAAPITQLLRARVQALDANLPIVDARTLSEQTAAGLSIYAMAAGILATFGGIAMLLAALGTYGMVSYSARESRHEIGIRIAIGASRAEVVGRFLARGLRSGAIGAAVGLVCSLGISRVLASLLYGVSGTDFVSFSAAAATVLIAVCGASLVPAWRASRVDPIVALRRS